MFSHLECDQSSNLFNLINDFLVYHNSGFLLWLRMERDSCSRKKTSKGLMICTITELAVIVSARWGEVCIDNWGLDSKVLWARLRQHILYLEASSTRYLVTMDNLFPCLDGALVTVNIENIVPYFALLLVSMMEEWSCVLNNKQLLIFIRAGIEHKQKFSCLIRELPFAILVKRTDALWSSQGFSSVSGKWEF